MDGLLHTATLPLVSEILPLAMHSFVLSAVLPYVPIPEEASEERGSRSNTYTGHFIPDTKPAFLGRASPAFFVLSPISTDTKRSHS